MATQTTNSSRKRIRATIDAAAREDARYAKWLAGSGARARDTGTFENFRYNQPYGANYSTERREVVFYNREYARLGARKHDEGQFPVAGLYRNMQVYDVSPPMGARRATYLRARAEIDARLVAAFAGYTVLFAHDDPDRVVPSGLVGHVKTHVCAPGERALHESLWAAWNGMPVVRAPAPAPPIEPAILPAAELA